jgi:hypothetical protein
VELRELFGEDLKKLSLKHYDSNTPRLGADAFLPGSFSLIVHRLAYGLHIELGARVTKVDWSVAAVVDAGLAVPNTLGNAPIILTLANGSNIAADRVICTLPLGVLQYEASKASNLFYPSFPLRMTDAMSKLSPGAHNKVQ